MSPRAMPMVCHRSICGFSASESWSRRITMRSNQEARPSAIQIPAMAARMYRVIVREANPAVRPSWVESALEMACATLSMPDIKAAMRIVVRR